MVRRNNNDMQKTTQKTKDRATRTPLKTGWTLIYDRCICVVSKWKTNYIFYDWLYSLYIYFNLQKAK
jgi:hypothetical protein